MVIPKKCPVLWRCPQFRGVLIYRGGPLCVIGLCVPHAAGLGEDQKTVSDDRGGVHDDTNQSRQSSGISSGSGSSPASPPNKQNDNKETSREEDEEEGGNKMMKQEAIEEEETDTLGELSEHGRENKKLPKMIPSLYHQKSKDRVFKMSSKTKLQSLLARIASWDKFYAGVENMTPTGCGPSSGDWSEAGPSSFPPFEGSPSSQPPSLRYNIIRMSPVHMQFILLLCI